VREKGGNGKGTKGYKKGHRDDGKGKDEMRWDTIG
jgi:hypothetical protein